MEVMINVASLFLIMLIGVLAFKKKIISDEIQIGLANILLKITLPLLVVTSFGVEFEEGIGEKVIQCFFYSILSIILAAIISSLFLLKMKDKEKKKILQFANVFSNCGFIGFPLINSVLGLEGVLYTSIFNMIFTIGLWTYGVLLYSNKFDKKEIKSVLTNPCIVAVYVGLILMIFNIQLPTFINKSFKIVGDMTTPLSMIIIGCILAKAKIKNYIKDFTIYYSAVLKLLLLPLVGIGIAYIIKDNSILMKTMILIQAMPAATMTSILAEKYNLKVEYSAVIVFITTLLSIITFPIITMLI